MKTTTHYPDFEVTELTNEDAAEALSHEFDPITSDFGRLEAPCAVVTMAEQHAIAMRASPSRGAQRYSDWLKSPSGMTFGDWLKNGEPEPDNTCSSCQGTGIGNPHTGSSCWVCNGRGVNKPAMEFDV